MPDRFLVGCYTAVTLMTLTAACGRNDAPTEVTTVRPSVVEVIDGDTVVVEFGAGRETVRLLGIDTPESVDPNRPMQCFGPEASQRLTALLAAGDSVRLERDTEARDRYGRLLAYLFVDDVLVNEVLLEEGFGALAIYEPNTAYRTRLAAAEARARTSAVGLWRSCGGPDVAIDPPRR